MSPSPALAGGVDSSALSISAEVSSNAGGVRVGAGKYSTKYQTNNSNRLIPGTPGKVTGGNSKKLGNNLMESMGLKKSTKRDVYQAQHIIPAEMSSHPVIQKIGMDLDDASNGIFLRIPDEEISSMSRHRGYHSVYSDFVYDNLNEMDINQSVGHLEKQVYNLQSDLRKLQESGLPLYQSQGASTDLWKRSLNRIRK